MIDRDEHKEVAHRQHVRALQDGRIMESQQYPRTGIVGEAGMQVEVSVNAPEQSHVIVTLLSGRDLAAVGISPAMARELAGHLQDAAMVVAARHGRQE